jgi:HlyD family secretion protein
LRATADGRVARLTAAVGNLATSAQSIIVVVPLEVWVTANFKETQLANMRLGQPLDISIDAYGRSYKGHLVGIQSGSGTAFSLLPAENATGNFVKVVQRVPVKVTFDQRPDVELGLVYPRGGISAGQAQSGLRTIRRGRCRSAGRGPDAGRMAERQSLLALVLSNQYAGRHHLQHRHLFCPTKFAREEKSTARALGQRSRF